MKFIGIIVNIFLPGVGSIIVGKWGQGVVQLVLFLTAAISFFMSFGFGGPFVIPLAVITWIWGIITVATMED